MTLQPLIQPSDSSMRAEMRIVRHNVVCERLSVSSAKLFDMVAKGQFPKPFNITPGGRAVGWLEHDVDAWIMDRANTGSAAA